MFLRPSVFVPIVLRTLAWPFICPPVVGQLINNFCQVVLKV